MELTTKQFREALQKLMPGYKWTVHKDHPLAPRSSLVATGTMSSGSNRTSTVQVTALDGGYRVKSAGFGGKARWEGEGSGGTLAQAFRDLQTHYERIASNNAALAAAIQQGRNSR